MDDIYVYTVDLPRDVDEMVTPCFGGYTVYLSSRLDEAQRLKAYKHALHHIENNDFERTDVQRIEAEAHGLVKPLPIEPPVKTAKRRKPRWLSMMEKRIELLEAFGIDPNEHALDEQDRKVM